jgi:hypothetical protein
MGAPVAFTDLTAPDPVSELLVAAASFGAVAKRRTPDHEQVTLASLRVDPDYQRPPDRDKIASMVEERKAGGALAPIKVNQRPDGSLWITDGQHRAAAAAICGEDTIRALITHVAQHDEPSETNLVAKIAEASDLDAVTVLEGCGAQRDGKRLVLSLGDAGSVAYVPHGEQWASRTERGALTVAGANVRDTVARLGLGALIDG